MSGGREPAVALDDVTFAYNGEPVLEQVSFSVAAGERVAIVGPNGGGKTTLLKVVLGLLRPQAGTVRVLGGTPESARPRLGYVPQHAEFDDWFPVSVREVVLMGRAGRHWLGRYGRADREAARAALNEVGLADLAARPFADLSGGQKQRVLIARALAEQTELLLLDEPTAHVDHNAAREIHDLLHRLSGLTILLVSHNMDQVFREVSRAVCVNRRVSVRPVGEGRQFSLVQHDDQCCPEDME